MSRTDSEQSFAVDATLEDLKERVEEYAKQIKLADYDKKFTKSYNFYYGNGYYARTDGLEAAGEQGEETRISINTYRNLLRYQLSLVTSDRPAFDVVPINSDYDSMASAIVGEEVLEYYLRVKKLEDALKDAVEKAIFTSEGFVALSWDTAAGDDYGIDEKGKPVKQGDIKFSTYAAWDVARDVSFDQSNTNWYILRDIKNKYDLAERFPEHKGDIHSLEYERNPFMPSSSRAMSSDACEVFTFYHKKTPAIPEGKLVIFTDATKLLDIPLPYAEVPVYRVAPANVTGTNLGYTDAFDILALQEASDELYSAVTTNNINNAKQCLVIPKDSDFNYRDLANGASILEVDPEVADAIRPLQLTQSSPETYNLLDRYETQMEKKTGINEVIRGDPSANLRSGNALALIAAQSIKYNSGLQQSYSRLLEDVGSAVLKFLQHFANTPRFIEVVGKNNRTFLKSFSKESLTGVSKVSAELSSPLSKTVAGRVQIAENLLQQGLIKRPEQYIAVLDTGKLEPIMESERTELLNIRSENEKFREGQVPQVLITDTHALHIREHRSVLDDPESRLQPDIVEATLAHLAEHERLWQEVSMRPALLLATQQQAAPQPQQPQQGGNPGVMQPPQPGKSGDPNLPSLPSAPDAASPEDKQALSNMNLQPPQ
jgi:hypothetical protein